jgi:hypothetical protein
VTGTSPTPQTAVDWQAWHAGYENPDSELGRRLALVQKQLRVVLDQAPPGPIRAISICAGQGHDIIGALAEHPRREHVSARLVELDAQNVALAQGAARAVGLERVEAIAADASLTDVYAGAVPADLLVVCGVFGNISAADIDRLIEQLPQLCAPRASVVWTRHRRRPDLIPQMRASFLRTGFEELAFAEAPPFGVGINRLVVDPQPFQPGGKLFDFIGYEALWPHLAPGERAALGALFRPGCSLVELVEAVRALPYGLPSEPTVESMLLEARGTSAGKHLFLAQALAQRFPQTQPVLMHRVYRLERDRAVELFGAGVAAAIPADGLTDVHRYVSIAAQGRRIDLDVTLAGAPWDGHSPLALACGEGEDIIAGPDPDAEMIALEQERCDASARAPFLAVLAAAGAAA